MTRRLMLGALVAIGLALIASPVAAVHKFGDTPFNYVQDQAGARAGCPSGTSNDLATASKLRARAVSITWNEVTDQDSQVPAPMTLARYDNDDEDKRLWWEGQDLPASSNYRRIYWHPAVGMWQMDDGGLGASRGVGKFSSETTAGDAIQYIRDQLCDGQNPYKVYSSSSWMWSGCSGGGCLADYSDVYNPGGPLSDFDSSANVANYGGAQRNQCYRPIPQVPNEYFTCTFVNANDAQGYTGWTTDPDGTNQGSGGRSPLANAFYVFNSTNSSGDPIEVRYWMEQNTPLGHAVKAHRPIGANSRSAGALNWFNSPEKLCDQDLARCSEG